jgi:hypothetical protein
MNAAVRIDPVPAPPAAHTVAAACREAGVAFVQQAATWGRAELSQWLLGPYAQVVVDCAPSGSGPLPRAAREPNGEERRAVLTRIRSARCAVVETLARLQDPAFAASVVVASLAAGHVAHHVWEDGTSGWAPTRAACTLADRVLSLFVADYLVRPVDYEEDASLCAATRAWGEAELVSLESTLFLREANLRSSSPRVSRDRAGRSRPGTIAALAATAPAKVSPAAHRWPMMAVRDTLVSELQSAPSQGEGA